MSFNKEAVEVIMKRGREAAIAQDSLLRKVAEKTAGIYVPCQSPRAFDFHADSLTISDVEIKGVLPKEKALLKERMDLYPGQRISREYLDDIVAKIYGTQCYDYVTYELLGSEEPFRLVVDCKKGPVHQLGIGVRADTEEIVSVLINLGLDVHKLHGHSYDLTGKISANPYLKFKWSYDMPEIPTVNASASFRWTDMGMLNFGTNNLSLKYFNASQEVYLSNMKWKFFDIRAGIRNDVFSINDIKSSQVIGDYDLMHLTNDFVSLFLEARTDTFDDGYFPTRGVNAGVSYSWTFAGLPSKVNDFHMVYADAKVVVPIFERMAFIPSIDFRFLLGDEVPVAYFNAIGGSLPGRYIDQQMPFVGVTNLLAMKNILTIYRADLRFKIARNHYLTGIVNYARDSDFFSEYVYGPGYFGAALEYSFDTIFGPLSANIHWSDLTNKVGFYLSAGYSF
jgi:NTE family protein